MGGKPVYPDTLTNRHWQKQKGIVAKVVKGETGIGAALDRLEKAFKAVEWGYFDPRDAEKMKKPRTSEALAERLEIAKTKGNQLENVRKEAFKVRDLCKAVGDKWAKSTVVPKSSRVHVQVTMVNAANQLALDIKSIDDTGYKAVQAEIDRVEKAANQMFEGWVDRLAKVIPQAKKNPTRDFYSKNMHQQVRGLSTAISKMEKYKKYHKQDDWNLLAGDRALENKDGEEMLKHIDKVEDALKKIQAAMR